MFRNVLLVAAAGICVHGCAQVPDPLTETKSTGLQLVSRLQGALIQELKKGPESAISVCRDVAPDLAGELSRSSGWRVSRVSLRVRNPLLGTPDAWETAALADFDKRAASGEDPAKLEKSEVVKEGGRQFQRYIKALPVQAPCLACHGGPDDIPEAVKAKLTAEYPQDRATGYALGQVRGGLTVKRPL